MKGPVGVAEDGLRIVTKPSSLKDARHWVVQVKRGGVWDYTILPTDQTLAVVPLPEVVGEFEDDPRLGVQAAVTFVVDRAGVASDKIVLELP